jgi:putative restriction endonuclease
VGAGWTRTEPDDKPSVQIEFDLLSETPVVPFSVLESPPFSGFHWSIQGSGVEVPDDIAEQLEEYLDQIPPVADAPVRVYEMQNAPNADEYVRALSALEGRINDRLRSLFRAHYAAPNHTATATELAASVGIESHAVVNSYYGRLGHQLCDFLGIEPSVRPGGTHRWWSAWSTGWTTPGGGFKWRMLPQVAEALERMGWVAIAEFRLPDELASAQSLIERALKRVTVNAYERSTEARVKCIKHYGATCFICGFDFGSMYGNAAAGYIHVHHLTPISEIASEYEVDPVVDLRPVCPNCHAVVHRKDPPYTMEEMRSLLRVP